MSAQKLLSQNFLWSRELVSKLIRDSSISQNDFVLEIGPGKGIITESLLGISRNIVAIETDGILFDLLKQRFSGNPTLTLIRGDFKPTPRVDSCLIRIEKRSSPLIDESLLSIYRDFIIYHFTRDRSATSQSPSFWLTRFGAFVGGNDLRMHNKVKGSFGKWQKEEQSLSKIHRTRTDKDWKKYE